MSFCTVMFFALWCYWIWSFWHLIHISQLTLSDSDELKLHHLILNHCWFLWHECTTSVKKKLLKLHRVYVQHPVCDAHTLLGEGLVNTNFFVNNFIIVPLGKLLLKRQQNCEVHLAQATFMINQNLTGSISYKLIAT